MVGSVPSLTFLEHSCAKMKAALLALALLAVLLSSHSVAADSTAEPTNVKPLPLSFTVGEPQNESESRVFAWTFLMLVTVLIIAFITGYTIMQLHCEYFSEAAGALVIGLLIGIAVKYIGGFDKFTTLIQFNQEFFFLVLLPPIIFESGYNMQKVCLSNSSGESLTSHAHAPQRARE